MAYPDSLLSRGEQVVLHKHPHWKVLVLPTVFFILFIGGGFALAAVLRNWQYHVIAWIVIGAVALLGLIFLTIAPFIRWRTEHFVITNFHVFFRSGILRRREHQIPLGHIQNMETSVSFWGRLLGFGSLIVESAADQPLEFENVASLPKVQSTLNQLIMDDRNRYRIGSDGVPDPGPAQNYPPAQYRPTQQEYRPTDQGNAGQHGDYPPAPRQ
jgi:membrane protein YdbS with pleckstrin-like domain